ncbi:transcription initiation factor TFIIA large subunit [Pelomyxa schiedti]|nr:transcription initiation factor TFIIA large subunit [Pelomyxa schiedti]
MVSMATATGGGGMTTTLQVYQYIMDDVVAKVADEFRAQGLDESLLDTLRTTWEEKLMETGAVSPPVATVPALIPTFITHRGPPMMRPPPQYPLDAYPTAYAYANQYGYATAMPGAPPELLPPPPTEAYMPRRPTEPPRRGRPKKINTRPGSDQVDGKNDLQPSTPSHSPSPRTPRAATPRYDGGPLGSDDDIDSEDDEFPNPSDLVLCLWEKVTRVKTKRKVVLRDGIMHLKDRETLFSVATGEFDF